MKKLLCAAVLAWLAGVAVATAWDVSELMVYLWGVPDVVDPEARARALSEAGFNVVDWHAADLDVLAHYGLKAMLREPTPEMAASVSTHAAVWGYFCGDEPYPEDAFHPIAERFRALEKADPHHPAFVNVLSTAGEFLRAYMKVVRPQILSFDYYQWWWGSDRFYEKLEQFRQAALLAGVPLACCVEATANPAVRWEGKQRYTADNARKLRLSVYSSLAYGVKGIEWFSSKEVFEPGSAGLTPSGRDVAALNGELKRIGPILVKLRSLDVFHTPPLSPGTRTAPKEHWVHLIGEERRPGLVLGMFEGEQGFDYMMVVNRDYRHSQSVVVKLQSKWLGIAPWQKAKVYRYGVEKLDKATGRWQTIRSSSFVGFTFIIAAGDGELFRVTTRVEK